MLPTNIYQFTTATNVLNTGLVTSGAYELGTIYKAALIPKGKKFTATEMLTPYATFDAVFKANAITSRGFVIGEFNDFNDKSQAEQTETTGYGSIRYNSEGKLIWELMWDNGGMTYEKVLKSFQGLQDQFDLIILDRDSNVILGTKPAYNTSGYVLQGFALEQIYSPLIKANDGKKRTQHSIIFGLKDADEFTKRHVAIQLDPVAYPVMSFNSLLNLELAMGTASGSPFTTTTVRLKVTTADGHIDLYDQYGAALAALASNWSAVTDATGAALTISTIAVHAATKSLLVTFASSTAAGASVTISTPSVSQMTATVPGFANSSLTMVAV